MTIGVQSRPATWETTTAHDRYGDDPAAMRRDRRICEANHRPSIEIYWGLDQPGLTGCIFELAICGVEAAWKPVGNRPVGEALPPATGRA